MKHPLLVVTALFATTFFYTPTATAQQKPSIYGDKVKADVKLNYVYSIEEALTRSRAEGKPIFFNCFADWAMPCHGMNMYVFSDANFAKWVEKHFIPLFIDVTDPSQKAIATKYEIKQFAHYLVLDSDGRIVHRIVGGKPLPGFQQDLEMALSPKTSLAGTEARYKKGNPSLKDLRAYLNALRLADEDERFIQVGTQILGKIKEKDYPRAENWPIISRIITDPNSELFSHIIANKAAYVKNVGEAKVNGLAEGLFYPPIAAMAAGRETYNAERLLDLYLGMQRAQLPDTSICYRMYEVAKLRGEQKYDDLLTLMEERGDKLGHERISLALTLDLPEQTEAQKQRAIAYLRKLAATQTERTAKRLNNLVDQLSQTEGLDIINNGLLSKTLEKAKTEKKLVFLDAYTAWCAPCKHMAKNVFPRADVGRALNPRYISLKIDMEKGEGPELAKRYAIKGFPTLLVLDAEGNVVKKLVGSCDANHLINALTTQLPAPEWGYWRVKQAYEKGDRTGNVLYYYTRLSVEASEMQPEEAQKMMDGWYKSLSDADFCAPSAWEYVRHHLHKVSPVMERAIQLYPELCKQHTAENVDAAFAQGVKTALQNKPTATELDSLKQLLKQFDRLPSKRPQLQKARLVLQSYIAELTTP
ncbi:MAG: thioredoxin family protein [Bacteroidales bacterium]|nr:thioredoxin family protein [Bacteroidales bacterium]